MEYKIIKGMSIYNLIVAGASKGLIKGFETHTDLKVFEVLMKVDNALYFLNWAKRTENIGWLYNAGFIADVVEERYSAGDRFEIVSTYTQEELNMAGAPDGVIDEVMLVRLNGDARLVSLRTGEVINVFYEYASEDGRIADEQLEQMVKDRYGKKAYAGKVT